MKSNSLTIGFLSITALILFIAQFIPVRPADAAVAIKDRDYSMVTARSTRGGETVYVIDNRSGQIAVFTWDAGQRRLVPMAAGDLSNAFLR
jgi:hypothetical protein